MSATGGRGLHQIKQHRHGLPLWRLLPMRRRGAALVEAALIVPIVVALLVGTVELGRVTYTYYMLEKLMYNLARFLGTQQGVNFCLTDA